MRNMTVQMLISLFAVVVTGCNRMPVEIIAHRGASYLAPENTLAAVTLGWDMDADVEVDIYLTQDNRIVAIHDKTTERTAGVDLTVAETTAAELRRLEVGRFKSEQFAGEPIPFLADILQTIPPGRKLYIEIKCGPEILAGLHALLLESGKLSQVVIIGFSLETVTQSRKLIDAPTYWLKGTEKNKETEQWIAHDPQLVQTAAENGLEGLDVHYAGVTQALVDAARAAGQKLYVWTVDDPEEALRLMNLGVTGITTNRPGWLREQIKEAQALGK